jgi:hypothetical protein
VLSLSSFLSTTVHGIPDETPTWINLYDAIGSADSTTTLIVEDAVKGKWAPGAEILITSHTLEWHDQQARKITSILDSLESGFVEIQLDVPIPRPTTVKDSADFAVEVAILSRNIVFEGGPDPNTLHGGQFLVFHTPNVAQTLEGVEIKNFGQQGYLGRYPIHFHFCGKVDGAVVAKNTIRQSNQRCVVVHGTHNLEIRENIAFDTKGHCFLLEDGHETGNMFIRNLGAQTGTPTHVIPDKGTNGIETDDRPSTFWITNPKNSFIGNVAAGSEESGFWFEPKLRGDRAGLYPDLDPRSESLTLFKDNIAHSNRKVSTGKCGALDLSGQMWRKMILTKALLCCLLACLFSDRSSFLPFWISARGSSPR